MKRINNTRFKVRHTALCKITIFCLIYFSKDSILFGTNKNATSALIAYIVFATLCFLCLLYIVIYRKRFQENQFIVFGMMFICFAVTFFLSRDKVNLGKYIYILLLIFISLMLTSLISYLKFTEFFSGFILFFAVTSIIGTIINYTTPSFFEFFSTIVNTSGYRFYNLLCFMAPYQVKYVAFRNYGIFREPGVFQTYLNLALLFELEGKKEGKEKRVIILLIAIFLTFSTAGYIICGIVVMLQMTQSKTRNIYFYCGIIITSFVFFFLVSNSIIEYDHAIFRKLFSDNASRNSRFGSALINLQLAKDHFLFGNGFSYVEANYGITRAGGFRGESNTNTVFKMLAVFGVLVPSIFTVGIIKVTKRFPFSNIFSLLILMMMLFNEDMMFSALPYVLMMYGWKEKD